MGKSTKGRRDGGTEGSTGGKAGSRCDVATLCRCVVAALKTGGCKPLLSPTEVTASPLEVKQEAILDFVQVAMRTSPPREKTCFFVERTSLCVDRYSLQIVKLLT
jgi:hypothetical protein